MPLTLIARVALEEPDLGRFWVEGLVRHAGDADKLSSGDARDIQRIPPSGTPSYTVLDLGAGWRFENDARISVRLENVTDDDYRVHGSGTNMPGRSFIVAFESRF